MFSINTVKTTALRSNQLSQDETKLFGLEHIQYLQSNVFARGSRNTTHAKYPLWKKVLVRIGWDFLLYHVLTWWKGCYKGTKGPQFEDSHRSRGGECNCTKYWTHVRKEQAHSLFAAWFEGFGSKTYSSTRFMLKGTIFPFSTYSGILTTLCVSSFS